MGSKKWINSEIAHLLDTNDTLLPEGKDKWEKWIRNGESYKKKIEKLAS